MSVDTDYLEASQGWTLQQALERTADPPSWDAWIAAKAALEKMNTLHPSAGGAVAPQLLEKIQVQRDVVAEMFDRLNAQLREQLLHGLLRAVGSRGSPGVFPTSIETTAWTNLQTIDPQNSVVREPGERGATIYNVRIFPLIHFDAVISEIPGCSLAEAFRRFVLTDPEVGAAKKRIPDWKKYNDVFVDGQMPGYIVSFEWPVELSSEDLAYNFVRPIFIDLYAPLPEAPSSIRHVAKIITDRWQRLRQRLIAGELVARGTYARTGT